MYKIAGHTLWSDSWGVCEKDYNDKVRKMKDKCLIKSWRGCFLFTVLKLCITFCSYGEIKNLGIESKLCSPNNFKGNWISLKFQLEMEKLEATIHFGATQGKDWMKTLLLRIRGKDYVDKTRIEKQQILRGKYNIRVLSLSFTILLKFTSLQPN